MFSSSKFQPINIVLKNGKEVLIREATKSDAGELIHLISTYLKESDHLLTLPTEFNPSKQDQKQWIDFLHHSTNGILLVAVHQKKIIGNIDLKGEVRKKTAHNATLGIGVLNSWQNLGLGNALMKAAIDWAQSNKRIRNIWLHVFENHIAAIHLYKKNGFKAIALQKDFIQTKDGDFINNLIMLLRINHITDPSPKKR